MGHGGHGGILRAKEDTDYYVTMYANVKYRHAVVGDDDTRDVGLQLYDERDKLVASASDKKKIASADATSDWTGPYRVRVSMKDCGGAAGCFWGSIVGTKE